MSLRFVLLGLLSKKPNTGYGMGRMLRDELSHIWSARLQQIYSELARLQDQGLVEAESIELVNRPAKKVYSLTPEGRALLGGWLERQASPAAPKDELLMRFYCLERLPLESAARSLDERRAAREREVGRLRRRLRQVSRTDPKQTGLLLTIEAALSQAAADLAWCTRTLAWLREERPADAAAQPTPRAARE